MKKEKTAISLSKRATWTFVIEGLIFVALGIIGCFNVGYLRFISACLLTVATIIVIVFFKINTDEFDEMAEKNLMESAVWSYRTVNMIIYIIIFALIGIYSYLKSKSFEKQVSVTDVVNLLIHIPFVFIGIKDILTGVLFIRKERE